jgi:hypothetical protein
MAAKIAMRSAHSLSRLWGLDRMWWWCWKFAKSCRMQAPRFDFAAG